MNGVSNRVARITVNTALQAFQIEATERGLRSVTPIASHAGAGEAGTALADASALAHARAAAEALRRYAEGGSAPYEGPLDAPGSDLERAVWERLRSIPFGVTTTYGRIAAGLGRGGDARAIGAAIAANPVAVLVPCHRVVGADGSLRGFAWGLDLKRRLLVHEGSATPSLFAGAGSP